MNANADSSTPVIDISVVLPCLNEVRTLKACIEEVQAAIEATGLLGEIIVADNGSTDGSQSLVVEMGARVVTVQERGYGHALRGGIANSHGRWVVMGDCDGSYDFAHLPRLVNALKRGNDLVLGNRFLGGIEPGVMPWKHQYIGNPVLTGIGRFLFNSPVGDFHCGLRGLSRTAFDRLRLSTGGMEFASEMVIKATLAKMQIAEVPTVLRPDGRDRSPHLRSWRDGWRHLRFMLVFSPQWLFVIPGLIMLMLGLILTFAILLAAPLQVGEIVLSINSAVAASLAIVLGVQLLLTGLFARVLATRIGLLPRSLWMKRIGHLLSIESGIAIGFFAILVGLAMMTIAVLRWNSAGFGPLPSAVTMRYSLPAMTMIILGAQLAFQSFLIGVLNLIPAGSSTPSTIVSSGSKQKKNQII